MLSKIILENFKSFKQKTVIDITATGCKILNDTNNTKQDILKGLLFIGSNASGKSTILKAFKFIFELLVVDRPVSFTNYISLIGKIENCKLKYEFKFKEDYIIYDIEFNSKGIINEKLYINTKLIISRSNNQAIYNKVDDLSITTEMSDNTLSAIRSIYFDTKFEEYPSLQLFMNYLNNSIYINQESKYILGKDSKEYKTYFENKGIEEFNKYLNEMKYNQRVNYVDKIRTKYYGMDFGDHINTNTKEVTFKRIDSDLELPYYMESAGNQTLVNILPKFIEVINNNGMIIIDEFHSSLHNILEERLINLFMNKSTGSQLFLVSHSTNLLTNLLYRPDQIYTVDYSINKGSYINRVSNFNPREAKNLEKMYLGGMFNGLPN